MDMVRLLKPLDGKPMRLQEWLGDTGWFQVWTNPLRPSALMVALTPEGKKVLARARHEAKGKQARAEKRKTSSAPSDDTLKTLQGVSRGDSVHPGALVVAIAEGWVERDGSQWFLTQKGARVLADNRERLMTRAMTRYAPTLPWGR